MLDTVPATVVLRALAVRENFHLSLFFSRIYRDPPAYGMTGANHHVVTAPNLFSICERGEGEPYLFPELGRRARSCTREKNERA